VEAEVGTAERTPGRSADRPGGAARPEPAGRTEPTARPERGDGAERADRQMRADARRNYDRLIAAAREAFTERGVEASLDDIAKRAGVGPGTLYRHFPNREALLAAVYRTDVEARAVLANQLAAEYSVEEALTRWLRLQVTDLKFKRGLGGAIKTMLGADSETFVFCRDMLRGAVGNLLVPAQQAGIIRSDVEPADVLRLVHGVAVSCESDPDQAERLLAIVLDGLRPAR
jgi:AcrR family transcriptional regulator